MTLPYLLSVVVFGVSGASSSGVGVSSDGAARFRGGCVVGVVDLVLVVVVVVVLSVLASSLF